MQLECLEMERAIFGKNVHHPSISMALGNLGNIRVQLGNLEEAEKA